MKTIPLTQNKEVLVDDEDFDELNKHKWCYTNGYAARRCNPKKSACHEYLHKRLTAATPGEVVLHLDGDKLNCQRANMVKSDRKLRQQRMPPRSASGYKGVSMRHGKWTAHIGVDGKTFHLGRFAEKDDAAREYDRAAIGYYGPNAQLNFPESLQVYLQKVEDNESDQNSERISEDSQPTHLGGGPTRDGQDNILSECE